VSSNFWQIISSDKFGERQVEVYSSLFTTGSLVKNVTTFFDAATGKVKAVSESMAFVPNSSGGGGGMSGPIGNSFSAYNEVTSVPPGILTSVLTFTAPLGSSCYLYRVEMSGENAARFDVYVNGVLYDTKYTSVAGPFDVVSDLTAGNSAGVLLAPGDSLEVKVIHSREMSVGFNARVQYVLVA
jgi:hypothetical protein